MSKRLKHLLSLLKEVFSTQIINSLALKTNFKTRQGKLTPEMFVALCVLYGNDLCKTSLVQLSTRLHTKEGIELSPQALDQRFNANAVRFLKELFEKLIRIHNKETLDNTLLCKSMFSKIKVVDSSVIQLPENLAETYKGSGGDSSKSSVKIQLEYEVLSGKFIECQINQGSSSDMDYLEYNEQRIQKNELHLKDLGYYKLTHLEKIASAEAFYISKLKSSSAMYIKNPNPEFKANGEINKSKEYKKIDIQQIAQPLTEGQSIDYLDTYAGFNKLNSRLIVTKLTSKRKENRLKKYRLDVRKGKKTKSAAHDFWNSTNSYITNIPEEMATADEIHNLYTLRWQIENMFKIWKSIFRIADIKKVKLERFQCFLYGRLIGLILSASIVSASKVIAMEEKKKTLSEIKAFSIASEYLEALRSQDFKSPRKLKEFIKKIIQRILKHGFKNEKKGCLSCVFVLDFVRCNTSYLNKQIA